MKRGIAVLLSVSVLFTVGYFTASKWAIRHETITFHDPERDNRPVAVDIAVRRDKEMQAECRHDRSCRLRSSTTATPSSTPSIRSSPTSSLRAATS